jgi:hypothetical protein
MICRRFSIFFCLLVAGSLTPLMASDSSDDEKKTKITSADLITPVLMRGLPSESENREWMSPVSGHAGLSFISSAVIPGLGQAANRNWFRAGIFAAIEVTAIYMAVDFTRRGARGEQRYENWADQNWSVVQYANWLVDYHDVHGIENPYIGDLERSLQGVSPAFDPSSDWPAVDISLLRNAERNTPYMMTDDLSANHFSHSLPHYGSQQYYELIAKYYQYQAGWRDFHSFHDQMGHTGDETIQRYLIDRYGSYASPMFWDGSDRSQQFNDLFRTGRHFMSLILVNHMISAFEAYFSVRLQQNRIQAGTGGTPDRQLTMRYHF